MNTVNRRARPSSFMVRSPLGSSSLIGTRLRATLAPTRCPGTRRESGAHTGQRVADPQRDVAVLDQQHGFDGERRERRVRAEEPDREERPEIARGSQAFDHQRQEETENERAREVGPKRRPREPVGRDLDPLCDLVTCRRAQGAAQRDREDDVGLETLGQAGSTRLRFTRVAPAAVSCPSAAGACGVNGPTARQDPPRRSQVPRDLGASRWPPPFAVDAARVQLIGTSGRGHRARCAVDGEPHRQPRQPTAPPTGHPPLSRWSGCRRRAREPRARWRRAGCTSRLARPALVRRS